MRWGKWLSLAAASAAAVPLLAGCGLSDYTYVSHRDGGGAVSYFKLPSDWKLFDDRQVIESANGHLTTSQISQIEAGNWTELFAGGPRLSLSQAKSIASSHPTGIVNVRRLGPSEADAYSWAAMRTEILSADPLNPPNPDPYVVLSYSQFTRPGGLRGSHMVVDIKSATGLVATLNQVTIVDQATHWVHLLAVSCTASCYGSNTGLINQVVNSWAVKER